MRTPKAVLRDFGNVIVRREPRVIDSRIFPARSSLIPRSLPSQPLAALSPDRAANIAAARRPGFDVHHFTVPAALRPALEVRGLL